MPDLTLTIELPILLYEEDGAWVAVSVATCTTSVEKSQEKAYRELVRLLEVEIAEVFKVTSEPKEFLDVLICPFDQKLFKRWITAEHCEGEPKNLIRAKGSGRSKRWAGIHSVKPDPRYSKADSLAFL